MNPYTGHLVKVDPYGSVPDGYIEVPDHLNRAASQVLSGRNEGHVSLRSGGKLSRWAAQQRKSKRKMERHSRKRNRRK